MAGKVRLHNEIRTGYHHQNQLQTVYQPGHVLRMIALAALSLVFAAVAGSVVVVAAFAAVADNFALVPVGNFAPVAVDSFAPVGNSAPVLIALLFSFVSIQGVDRTALVRHG